MFHIDYITSYSHNDIMGKTIETIRAGKFSDVLPEFGRTADVQRHFGIKRGTLYNLLADGRVRGVVLRSRGQVTGIRLWDMASIRAFIEKSMET
jgi:hypothetical protein